jgi:hypothetical protein
MYSFRFLPFFIKEIEHVVCLRYFVNFNLLSKNAVRLLLLLFLKPRSLKGKATVKLLNREMRGHSRYDHAL